MTNILLIDQHLPDSSVFVDSCNENTVPFLYSQDTTREQLLQFLQQTVPNSQIQRLCFAFEIKPNYIFFNNEPLFDIENMCINANTQFLINIIQQYSILNVDFLACESLLDNTWSNFYKLLMENTKVIVGASNNKTGNLLFGGDWVMESTNTDIELIYFNKSIEYYKYLLGQANGFTVLKCSDNSLWACGWNISAQLGDNTVVDKSKLTKMIMPTGIIPESISYGQNFTIVLTVDGILYGCGANYEGQLGSISSQVSILTLIPNGTGKTVKSVSCGRTNSVVLMTDGTIYGFGRNFNGELGLGTYVNVYTLTPMIMPIGLKAKSVCCAADYTTVLFENGDIYTCGQGGYGNFGNGATTIKSGTLVKMNNTTGRIPAYIICGQNHTIVHMTDKTLWGVGFNYYGQLGLGNNNLYITTLTQMTNNTGKIPKSVYCGLDYTSVLMEDNTLWIVGNNYGQYGTETLYNYSDTYSATYTSQNTLFNMTMPVVSGAALTPKSVICLQTSILVLMTNNNIYGCGRNFNGELGLGFFSDDSRQNNNPRSSYSRGYVVTTLQQMINPTNFTPAPFLNQVITTGLSVSQLYNEGYTVLQLYNQGFTVSEIQTELGLSISDLFEAGISLKQLFDGNVSVLDLLGAGYSIADLYAAGITINQLIDAPKTLLELYAAGITIAQLITAGKSIAALYAAGITLLQLFDGNVSVLDLLGAGYSIAALYAAGITLLQLFNGGTLIPVLESSLSKTLLELYNAGITARQILNKSPYTVEQLLAAGITEAQLIAEELVIAPTINSIETLIKTYGDAAFPIANPGSNSVGSFSYISSNSGVASINGSTVTILAAGTVTITATQSANGAYLSGIKTFTLTVAKATPTIGVFENIEKTYGDAPFPVNPSSTSGGVFTYTSSAIGVATVSGSQITILAAGTVTITATQEATNNYNLGTIQLLLTVNKATPTITNFSNLEKTYGDSPFPIGKPGSNSDGSFSYESSDFGVASINGSTVTILAARTVTITATQEATNNYNLGTIQLLLTVNKATPVLTNFSNLEKTFNDSDFPITAPVSTGDGVFSYTSSAIGVATVSGSQITILAAGTVTITATQASTSNYNSQFTTLTLIVAKANPTITDFSNITKTYGDAPFPIIQTNSNSDGVFSYESSAIGVAFISGTDVTIVAAGTVTITATQSETDNYTSGTIELQMTINPSTLLNPTEIINDNTLLFFQNTSAVYGNIMSSIEFSQNLTATTQKIIFTTDGSKTITSANK